MYSNLNLLYVEDDINIRENYCFVLSEYFKDIYQVASYEDALDIYESNKIHIMIVDINLDGYKSGIDLIEKIRKKNLNVRIIVTSAYSTIENLLRVSSLNLTLFLTKPLDNKIFIKSINDTIVDFRTIKITKEEVLELGENYHWDFAKKELHKDNNTISLTKIEKEVLNYILSNPSIELSYDLIIDNIWDYDDKTHIETLRTIVYNLRKKLPKDTIKTLYNIGYRYK